MARYFDPSESADEAYLHSSVRSHSEADQVAQEAEADVIAYFTRRGAAADQLPSPEQDTGTPFLYVEGDYYWWVDLEGYHSDPTQADGYDATRASWTGFAAAMRRAIALVVSYRLRQYDDLSQRALKRERRGDREWEYADEAAEPDAFPPRWKRPLRRYDLSKRFNATWAI